MGALILSFIIWYAHVCIISDSITKESTQSLEISFNIDNCSDQMLQHINTFCTKILYTWTPPKNKNTNPLTTVYTVCSNLYINMTEVPIVQTQTLYFNTASSTVYTLVHQVILIMVDWVALCWWSVHKWLNDLWQYQHHFYTWMELLFLIMSSSSSNTGQTDSSPVALMKSFMMIIVKSMAQVI